MPPADPPPTLRSGDRIQLDGARGTVRYVGPVAGQTGLWVGVDWDLASRGLHDGAVRGARYFTASAPTSGSLVRAERLGGARRSLQDAIRLRLRAAAAAATGTDGGGGVAAAPVGWRVGRAEVTVQFRAAPPKRDAAGVADAPVLDLSALGVTGFAGPLRDQDVGLRLASVRSLRVAESLFADWGDVPRLLAAFPALRYLDVARNRFDAGAADAPAANASAAADGDDDDVPATPPLPAAPGLEELVLNGCNVALPEFAALCAACPGLRVLRAFSVGLKSLRAPRDPPLAAKCARLRVADLGGNRVPWADVEDALGALPGLEELFLREAGIGAGGECVKRDGLFPALRRLSVSDNPIADWTFVAGLARVPSLRALLIADTPLTADEALWDPVTGRGGPDGDNAIASRHGIIARLEHLEKLHGSAIAPDERAYAEKRYLAVECLPAVRAKGREHAEQAHPRMRRLCEMYDIDLDGTANTARLTSALRHGRTLRADLVPVMFKPGPGTVAAKAESVKMLPRCVHVGKLRAMGARFLGMKRGNGAVLRMTHNEVATQLENENSTLAEMHVMPGDNVVIVMG